MIYIVPDVLQQLIGFGIEEEKIKQIIILHSHFDHIGIVSFFKKRWPWAKITASARAKKLLSSPKVVEIIATFNQALIAKYERKNKTQELDLAFTGIEVENVVGEGDVLSCGDLTMDTARIKHSSLDIGPQG
ncbi:MAG: MBL fold metallo-hydrolase [Deltaproteobacteria bacterium]|nr:MBL fold metallo-hydrolase [Deltaproteobacteria bacterium]